MPAPTPTARVAPTGYKLPDGFKSTITFANQPAVQFWERGVKPPAIDGGDAIDTSTMFNTRWHTMFPRHLLKMDDGTVEAGYDPDFMTVIIGMVNVVDTITITWPDGSTLCFFGFLKKIEFSELKEGEFPICTPTFSPTQANALDVEFGPVFTPAGGT